MNSRRRDSHADSVTRAIISRRKLLALSGVVAVGGLSGCLGRVASSMTNTGTSPAAPFAGIGAYTGPSPTSEPTVYKLTPTASAGSGLLSGEVELEAWVTSTALAAIDLEGETTYTEDAANTARSNYNNSRSNKSKIRSDDTDSDGGGLGDHDYNDAPGYDYNDPPELGDRDYNDALRAALDLENTLLSQTTEAVSISKRSARTGRGKNSKEIDKYFDNMRSSINEIQETLESCSDDVCVTVREHAEARKKLTQQAATHVDNGEWSHAAEALQEIQGIVEGDIEPLEKSLQDTSEHVLENPPLQDLTGASDEDIAALYEYLAGEPVFSEQFTITVPDASLPGSDVAVGDELTPRRIIEYVTGRADTDGKVYAWGDNKVENGGGNTSPIYEGDAVGGESVLNRGLMSDDNSLYNSDTFLSAVSGPVDTGIHLESDVVDGRVTVNPVNDPPQATETTPALAVSADGASSEPADFDEWGAELGESSTTSTLVCPIMIAPPECPSPFPALLYVRRCKHADQYIYTGGWVIDDGSLYGDSITLVAVGEPTAVIGVGAGDLDGDGYGDVMARRLSGERERRGARLFDGAVSDAVSEGHLSEAEGEDIILRKRLGRTRRQEEGTAADVPVTMTAQGRLVHFTGASASDDVKFKAGAELSKSVN